ncbi:carboxypeptidase regulatory-like domain-containing protein [Candidatus Bathyarchaeota archaeon]|nr:carboxypeptidase regulatory-like domain-containing protein [Candidatus Bathyarchaeota archaeon]
MRRKLAVTIVTLLLILAVLSSSRAESLSTEFYSTFDVKTPDDPTQPVGTIAAKLTAVPTTVTGYLAFRFDAFIANATATSPTCTIRVTQNVSADASEVLQADPTPTTPLSNIYALDYTPYIVDALNDTTKFKASGILNVTLGSHYILNETWVENITITIYGNTSITMDTLAEWYAYNFTSGSYYDLGTLNSVTRSSLTVTISSGIASLIDEENNNVLMLKYNYTDTTNTDFELHIDYVEVAVTYQLNITVSNWIVKQVNSTIEISPATEDYTVNFWDNFTLEAPSGIANHNFTVYIYPPNHTHLLNHNLYVSGVKVSPTVTDGEVSVEIANLVSNSTALNFNAKIKVKFLNKVLIDQLWCKDIAIRYNERQRIFNLTLTSDASAFYYENLSFPTHVPYEDRVGSSSTLGRTLTLKTGSPMTKIVISYMQSGEKESIKFIYRTSTKLRVTVTSSITGQPIKGAKVTIDAGFIKRVGKTNEKGIVEFRVLVGGLRYTVTIEKGGKTYETIVEVKWDKTNKLTVSLAILVFPWWLSLLFIIILILIVLAVIWRRRETVTVPRIVLSYRGSSERGRIRTVINKFVNKIRRSKT